MEFLKNRAGILSHVFQVKYLILTKNVRIENSMHALTWLEWDYRLDFIFGDI